jgi:hypothetical protein
MSITDRFTVRTYQDSPLLKRGQSTSADVVIRHHASGQSVYLHSQLINGWSESFLNERLSSSHFPLRAVIDFFESISLIVPSDARVHDGKQIGDFDAVISRINRLLVGDYLGVIDDEENIGSDACEKSSVCWRGRKIPDTNVIDECVDHLYWMLEVIEHQSPCAMQVAIDAMCYALRGIKVSRPDFFSRMGALIDNFGYDFHAYCVLLLGESTLASVGADVRYPRHHYPVGKIRDVRSPPDLVRNGLANFSVNGMSVQPQIVINGGYICDSTRERAMADLPFVLRKSVVADDENESLDRSLFAGSLIVHVLPKDNDTEAFSLVKRFLNVVEGDIVFFFIF